MKIHIFAATPPREPSWLFRLRTGGAWMRVNHRTFKLTWGTWNDLDIPDEIDEAWISRPSYHDVQQVTIQPTPEMWAIYHPDNTGAWIEPVHGPEDAPNND